ncbi:dihydrofolate reductase family protein [Nocardia puris]|uniref:Riboflavin biosynthesis protein RibD n=1 Tax=Nocardia puris TaxID=208602 RepID=A0A366DNM1_9NOCA|nr:dihydrofolate reductase family protein [Nocardia puris]RBO91691.1 diaminohydroxyphosphoribosylaminopyrimidine deaminase [Nocardia puris]
MIRYGGEKLCGGRPYVVLSVAMSLDGYIDDASPDRLLLSDAEDFERIDGVRAQMDAILVGASTLRRDNPGLLVKHRGRQDSRAIMGMPFQPTKVTITASGDLDPGLRFFYEPGAKLIYTTDEGAVRLERHARLAEVVSLGPEIDLRAMLDDLGRRDVIRLMVEGGTSVHTAFLAADLADELHIAVAPILVGDPAAPRFVHPAEFPGGPTRRLRLAEVGQVGDMAVMIHRRAEPDHHFLRRAIELAHRCPPSDTAFSVGAVIVADGAEIATGYSRETDAKVHAEEAALNKLDPKDRRLERATLYSTLEPCSKRGTADRLPCTDRILEAGIRRVVIAWREPATFVENCVGVEKLREHGVEVVELSDLAEAAMEMNRHLKLS